MKNFCTPTNWHYGARLSWEKSQTGQLSGACLDVFPKKHPEGQIAAGLYELFNNVTTTPNKNRSLMKFLMISKNQLYILYGGWRQWR